jgi:hypothetical protein
MSKPASVEHDEPSYADGGNDEIPAVDIDQFRIQDQAAYARAVAAGDTVLIFDTTLRDGEQSPGATLHIQEKLEIAHQLARLGVDIMEAGFPAASPGDLEAVRRIANTVGRTPRRGKNGEVARAAGDRRASARQQERHRQGMGGCTGRRAPAHPHLPGDQRHSHGV